MNGEVHQGVVAFQPTTPGCEAVMLGRIEVGEIGPVRDPRSRFPFYFRIDLPHSRTNARLNPAMSIEDARQKVADKINDWMNAAGVAPAAFAIASIPPSFYWLMGKGRTRPDEPLYAIQLIDPESGVAIVETEAEELADVINAAVKKLGGR